MQGKKIRIFLKREKRIAAHLNGGLARRLGRCFCIAEVSTGHRTTMTAFYSAQNRGCNAATVFVIRSNIFIKRSKGYCRKNMLFFIISLPSRSATVLATFKGGRMCGPTYRACQTKYANTFEHFVHNASIFKHRRGKPCVAGNARALIPFGLKPSCTVNAFFLS